MRNRDLARDYVRRAAIRLEAIEVLRRADSWADVVRESQEVVELALKALLMDCGVAPPRIHDVSAVLLAEKNRLPKPVQKQLKRLVGISRKLRRDRELAFYGAVDLTPSQFYGAEDAQTAFQDATKTVELVRQAVDSEES